MIETYLIGIIPAALFCLMILRYLGQQTWKDPALLFFVAIISALWFVSIPVLGLMFVASLITNDGDGQYHRD